MPVIDNNKSCCKNCGHVTYYSHCRKQHYECMGRKVAPNGICDRYQRNVSVSEICKKLDKAIAELDKVEDGQYELKERPPFGQNYRVVEGLKCW